MKLKGKHIAFGLTSPFYTFKNTIAEMKNINSRGGEIIPIMPIDTYNNAVNARKTTELIKEIEEISKKRIITCNSEAEKSDADIMVIAPCSRKLYCKTCVLHI